MVGMKMTDEQLVRSAGLAPDGAALLAGVIGVLPVVLVGAFGSEHARYRV